MMDVSTVISTAIGVVLGGVITWLTSWYFAKKAARDTEQSLEALASQLNTTLPGKTANALTTNQVVNTVLAASPLMVRLLVKLADQQQADTPPQEKPKDGGKA